MPKYSIVKIELNVPPGTEYKVYWNQAKHNHDASTATGTWAMTALAANIGVPITSLTYRPKSFQSNQSSPPEGNNTFEVP